MRKRGQVTIFIIIAIVIVGIILAYFLLVPKIKEGKISIPFYEAREISTSEFLKECIEDDLEDNIEILSKQGGYLEPEGYVMYKDEKIKYLCYTNEYFKTCTVQQPSIKNHFEKELTNIMAPKIRRCADELKESYENRGYSVLLGSVDSNISIVLDKIKVNINAPMTITKETSRSFENYVINFPSKMYDLLMIAGNIIEFEAYYGDSEITTYIQSYPELNIEKIKRGDSSTIYIVSNVITGEDFTFASRSLVWPPGYGIE